MAVKAAQLLYFVTVAQEGQITRASRKLNIAQPALSQSIANLESELGFALLVRHPRGVTLTPSGEVFFEKAREALAAATEAENTARSLARASKGELEIGFLASPPAIHSGGLFAEFSNRHPEIDVSFRELPFPGLSIEDWLDGVDVGIAHMTDVGPGLHIEILRSEPRAIVLPRAHRLAGQEGISVSDVLDETFIGFHPSLDPGWVGFWTLNDHRGEPPAHSTADKARGGPDLFTMLAEGRGVMAGPACHAALVAQLVPSVVTVPLLDATPGVLAFVWREESANALLSPLLTLAREMRAGDADVQDAA
jgi:DNA-binding transcriptional LysR family regulator